jgi:Polyketide cyclase / dehydrase and lipid transport
MGKASAAIDIPASPNEVWHLIGGFNSLPDWLTYIPKSELSEDGLVRHLATLKGETIVERLEDFDNTARSYSYSIIQAPFPVTGYLSTLRVKPAADGNGSVVEWTATFAPKTGVSDEQASKIFQGIFEEGLKELASRFNSLTTKSKPSHPDVSRRIQKIGKTI